MTGRFSLSLSLSLSLVPFVLAGGRERYRFFSFSEKINESFDDRSFLDSREASRLAAARAPSLPDHGFSAPPPISSSSSSPSPFCPRERGFRVRGLPAVFRIYFRQKSLVARINGWQIESLLDVPSLSLVPVSTLISECFACFIYCVIPRGIGKWNRSSSCSSDEMRPHYCHKTASDRFIGSSSVLFLGLEIRRFEHRVRMLGRPAGSLIQLFADRTATNDVISHGGSIDYWKNADSIAPLLRRRID